MLQIHDEIKWNLITGVIPIRKNLLAGNIFLFSASFIFPFLVQVANGSNNPFSRIFNSISALYVIIPFSGQYSNVSLPPSFCGRIYSFDSQRYLFYLNMTYSNYILVERLNRDIWTLIRVWRAFDTFWLHADTRCLKFAHQAHDEAYQSFEIIRKYLPRTNARLNTRFETPIVISQRGYAKL